MQQYCPVLSCPHICSSTTLLLQSYQNTAHCIVVCSFGTSLSSLAYCCLKSLLPEESTGQDWEANPGLLHENFSGVAETAMGVLASNSIGALAQTKLLKQFFQSSPFAVPWFAGHSSFRAHKLGSLLRKRNQEHTQCPPDSHGQSGHGTKVWHQAWGNLRFPAPTIPFHTLLATPHCWLVQS